MTTAGSRIAIDARYVNGHMSGMARYTLNLLHGLESAHAAPPMILLTSEPAALPVELRSSAAFQLLRLAGRPGPGINGAWRGGWNPKASVCYIRWMPGRR